tara:strand:+ start:1256 stop:1882 length:627 start_codon:yes stop_codon:yes gene_type:complete
LNHNRLTKVQIKKIDDYANNRLKNMITPAKISKWKIKITNLVKNQKFDGTQNVNIFPVSEDPVSEVIVDICRNASNVTAGLLLEDIISVIKPDIERAPNGSGYDLFRMKSLAIDCKMADMTVKKSSKPKASDNLSEKSRAFQDCCFVEFFGKAKTENFNGVNWYTGKHAHELLGLDESEVTYISKRILEFRKNTYAKIKLNLTTQEKH